MSQFFGTPDFSCPIEEPKEKILSIIPRDSTRCLRNPRHECFTALWKQVSFYTCTYLTNKKHYRITEVYPKSVLSSKEGENINANMTNLIDRDWRLLPDLALADVMLMVGLDSLESLHRCRQVCRTWNEKIMNNIWGNKRNKKIIKAKIEKSWGPWMHPSMFSKRIRIFPSNDELSHAKWLGKRFNPITRIDI